MIGGAVLTGRFEFHGVAFDPTQLVPDLENLTEQLAIGWSVACSMAKLPLVEIRELSTSGIGA